MEEISVEKINLNEISEETTKLFEEMSKQQHVFLDAFIRTKIAEVEMVYEQTEPDRIRAIQDSDQTVESLDRVVESMDIKPSAATPEK